ncbi:MAG: lipopolysaccharide biosynthesis protein [Tannerella sp.]|jgi:PST family polysaccharide transporter|nr:lipopolysaccharide biosynthesis protein [Tannerella sp.]
MSVKKELISGFAYTAIAKYIGIAISFIITAVLSRLLLPEEFGIVAVATVLINFFNLLSDMGIAPAIVQNKSLNSTDYSNIFSFTIWIGVILAILFFIISPFISAYYKNEQLLHICRLLSVNIMFVTWNIIPNALLYKEKMFKYLAYRNLIVQLIGGSLAVIVALNGLGIYALLVNPIFTAIVMFFISYARFPQKLRLFFRFTSIQKIRSFSIYQFFFNMVNYFSRNLDKLVIGRVLGSGQLGYYEKSYRMMMLPLENITFVINPVMLPVFSEFQNDLNRLSTSYMKVIRTLAFVGFSLTLLLFFAARELVLLIFGLQWEPSVGVFRILSLSVGIQIILSTAGSIFQAANSTKVMFFTSLITAAINISGLFTSIFLFGTIEAVAYAVLIAFAINFFVTYYAMFRFTFYNMTYLANFLKQLVSPLCMCLLIAIVLFFMFGMQTYSVFQQEYLNLVLGLVVKGFVILIGVVSYVQLRGYYDIWGRVKMLVTKNRRK